jgi:hypothetical protein
LQFSLSRPQLPISRSFFARCGIPRLPELACGEKLEGRRGGAKNERDMGHPVIVTEKRGLSSRIPSRHLFMERSREPAAKSNGDLLCAYTPHEGPASELANGGLFIRTMDLGPTQGDENRRETRSLAIEFKGRATLRPVIPTEAYPDFLFRETIVHIRGQS